MKSCVFVKHVTYGKNMSRRVGEVIKEGFLTKSPPVEKALAVSLNPLVASILLRRSMTYTH